MADHHSQLPVARRSFLSRIGASVTLFGAALGVGESSAAAQSAGSSPFQPTRHTLDDWMDQLPGKHRFVFDTTNAAALGSVLLYANNFFIANQSGYGLSDKDAAVVIVVRHNSTGFAYTDAIWSKYGTQIADRADFNDPKTKARPVVNVYNTAGYGQLSSNGITIDALIKRGVHFAVCQMATRRIASTIAEAKGIAADTAYNELVTNLVANAHIVPAGIVAVNRAQERGYTFGTA